MIALAACEDRTYAVAIGASAGEDDVQGWEPGPVDRPRPVELVPGWASATLVDVDAAGSTVVLAVERRPPLLVSHDRGETWTERGGGLPRARAVAIGESPDHILYASRNRLYVSTDGGRFWRAVGVELPEIRDVAWASG